MFLIQTIKSRLQDDPLFRRVLRNSSYLFSSNTLASALGLLQGILVFRLLGDTGSGLLAIVMDFPSNVNRLLSFRMSEVTVKYAGEALVQDDKERAAALVKGIALAEAVTSLVAYLVLYLLATWGAQTFAQGQPIEPLFRFYGLILLASLVYETSLGVLQATDNFKQAARANFYQSLALTVLIAAVFILDLLQITNWGLRGILAAYLVGKTIAGVVVTGSASRELKRRLGHGWMRAPLRIVSNWKPILRFAFSTNLNGTVNLFARDNIRLYIAALVSPAAVGYFSLASKLINLIMVPLDPLIAPTYAEITRSIAARQWAATRKLLKQVSAISAAWTLLVGGGLAATGWWLIPFVYGREMTPAYPAFLLLLIGYGAANIANWNRPLLLALGKPALPLLIAAITGAAEVALIFLLVPRGGYLVGAAIVSAYFVVSIGWTVWLGLRTLKREETLG
ncbi:MAG: lipopolysaccharide biosynthesis protein [Chloroflexota bacterium]|nr:lipopolysaccharide biosynthesis protein [Chloroflexota bacterium]MBI5703144.1 lipopolysaccharide biosynthesis protein [Chloroflexota bacterium]